MKKIVVFECYDFEVTLREVLFSIIIAVLMITLGFFISEKISSCADEKNQEYEQAAKIDNDKELFEYGMRTNIGNAFVFGTLKAVDPVSISDIEGEYSYILKIKEEYTKHTRTVTDYDEDGEPCGSHTETYYEWDEVGHEDFTCTRISFLEHEFPYGKIEFPSSHYLTTEQTMFSDVRYVYYVCEKEYAGTIYADLRDNTISKAEFIQDKGVDDAVEYMCGSEIAGVIVFWVIWIILIAGAVFGFVYWDNRWIED